MFSSHWMISKQETMTTKTAEMKSLQCAGPAAEGRPSTRKVSSGKGHPLLCLAGRKGGPHREPCCSILPAGACHSRCVGTHVHTHAHMHHSRRWGACVHTDVHADIGAHTPTYTCTHKVYFRCCVVTHGSFLYEHVKHEGEMGT